MSEIELRKLVTKYKFTSEDIWREPSKDLILVSARGIRRMIDDEQFTIKKTPYIILGPTEFIAVTTSVLQKQKDGAVRCVEAIGEASKNNTVFKFPIAVAEKRSESRAVLMFIGVYHKGVIGEVELDEETESIAIIQKRKGQRDLATENLMKDMGIDPEKAKEKIK